MSNLTKFFIIPYFINLQEFFVKLRYKNFLKHKKKNNYTCSKFIIIFLLLFKLIISKNNFPIFKYPTTITYSYLFHYNYYIYTHNYPYTCPPFAQLTSRADNEHRDRHLNKPHLNSFSSFKR